MAFLKRKFIFVFFFFVTLISNLTVHAGGALDGGGGSPYSDAYKKAWFLNKNRVINYCILSDKNFDIKEDQVATLLEAAFKQWSDYLAYKKIQINVSTSVKRTYDCKQADLELYLGIENEIIRQEKLKYKMPIAFVHKDLNRSDKIWSKGLLWLAKPNSLNLSQEVNAQKKQVHFPDFHMNKKLYTILLHEVGHLMGNGHMPNTIMDESVFKHTFDNVEQNLVNTQIDLSFELAHCSFCKTVYPVKFNNDFLELLTGFRSGKIENSYIEVFRTSIGIDTINLIINAEGAEKKISLLFYDYEFFPISFFDVFSGTNWPIGGPELRYGFFEAFNGQEVKVILKYNMQTTCKDDRGFIKVDIPYSKEMGPFYLSPTKKKKNLFRVIYNNNDYDESLNNCY